MGNIDFDFSKSLTDFSNFREKSLNNLKKLLVADRKSVV